MLSARYFNSPGSRRTTTRPVVINPDEFDRVATFYRRQPQNEPTPLYRLPGLASVTGLGEILLKDESQRFDLPAFKILGVLYAFERILEAQPKNSNLVVACASAGNHGRAVARAARMRGLSAKIYLPVGVAPARIDAIVGEGAEVVVTDQNYEGSIRLVNAEAKRRGWQVVSDTAWDGYETIPRWIMAGYSWLMEEASLQWDSDKPPDAVFVQAGVGGLACAVLTWLDWKYGSGRPPVVVCEPSAAPCLLESARAGQPVAIADRDTMMACLRCAEISPVVWPVIENGFDAFVAVDDKCVADTIRQLAYPNAGDPTVIAGACGACGLAVLLAVMNDSTLRTVRETAQIGSDSRVLVINSEGATDPEIYRSIVN